MVTINYEKNGVWDGVLTLEDQGGKAIRSAWQASLDHGTAVIVIKDGKWINADRATVAKILDPTIIGHMTEDRHP